MCFPLSIQIHHDIAWLPSLLPGERKAPRVQNHNSLILLQTRPVSMTKHNNIKSPGHSIFLDHLSSHGDIIVMSMC